MIGRKYYNFLWRYGNILFYSQIVHDSGLSWKLHLKAKYTGFDKWKCSWSKVTINTRFTLAKSHGKPKKNEHIGGQPELDWNKRQGIVSENIANCKNKTFLLFKKLRENFQSFHFCSWCKQRSTHTPFFFKGQKILKRTHLWWLWIVFVVWLTDVRPLILFPGRSISIMLQAGFEPTQNLISGFNKWGVTGGGRGGGQFYLPRGFSKNVVSI